MDKEASMKEHKKIIIAFLLLFAVILLFLAWRQGWLPNWNVATMRDLLYF
jgi:hypothetical protein